MDSPIIQKKKGISPIWILPLIALSIGSWLLYTSYRDAGTQIAIHYADAEGITPGKTQVMYKGVAVGLVEQVTVDDDLQGVSLIVNMKVKKGLVEDTKFWLVKPEISAGRISGLETLLTGSYIAVQPGTSSVQARQFEGLTDPPVLPSDRPGLHITLRADALHSMQKGSPVYTKNLQIGKVKDYKLADDNSILIDIYIEPKFSHLIRVGTRFWNASGISLEGNLQSGFNLNMESLASLIYGGISCGTPESLIDDSPQAVNGMVFRLYNNYDSAEYGLYVTLQLASGEGIVEGKTRVLYRGLEAGVVKKTTLNNDTNHTVTAEILLDPRAETILKQSTRFWAVRPEISIDGIRHLGTIITGPYITFKPGSGEFQDHFIVEEGPMPKPPKKPGRHYTLISEDSGSLEVGASVLYKKIIVGEIRDIAFGPEAKSIHTDILIYDEYAHLIRENTAFWNVSGIEIEASLSHINVSLSSLKSIMAGGIAFTNPKNDSEQNIRPADEGKSFALYGSFSQATKNIPALRPRGTLLKLESSADNIFEIGSPVLYKWMPVGEILDLALSEDRQKIIFEVLIHEKYAELVNTSTVFYNFSGISFNAALSGVEITAGPIATILTGGVSFITPEEGDKIENGHTFPLYKNQDAALFKDSIALTIHLDKGDTITEDTIIKYQGIQIGSIKKMRFTPDMKGVIAEAKVQKEAAKLFRETTRLWLVKPEIGLSGVRHLETVLTGSYIDITPGDGALQTDFVLLPESSGTDSYAGLNIVLETPRLGSLNKNSPVYFRQILVGRVTGFELSPNTRQVWVKVNIHPAYINLVHTGTKFWLASGIRVSWGLFSGLDLDTESMEAIVAGGIALATPEGDKMGGPTGNGDHFTLYENSEKTWLDWSPEIMLNEGTSEIPEPEKDEKSEITEE